MFGFREHYLWELALAVHAEPMRPTVWRRDEADKQTAGVNAKTKGSRAIPVAGPPVRSVRLCSRARLSARPGAESATKTSFVHHPLGTTRKRAQKELYIAAIARMSLGKPPAPGWMIAGRS